MSKNKENEVSKEDQDEIDTYKQLIRVEGGGDLVDSIVNESLSNAVVDIVEATLDLRNKEAYSQILEEDL